MGKIETDHTGSGGGITLSSDGTSLLLDGTAIGGGGGGDPDLYRDNETAGATTPSATGGNAVSIGNASSSSGLLSIAFGYAATSTAQCSTAIGASSGLAGSRAIANGAVALGGSSASGVNSFAAAIGGNSAGYGAQGANSIAIGLNAEAEAGNSIAIGSYNVSRGDGSVSLGYSNDVSGTGAVAIGSNHWNPSFEHTQSRGVYAKPWAHAADVWSSGRFSSTGDAQSTKIVLRAETTDATPKAMAIDGYSSTYAQLNIVPKSAWAFTAMIVAREDATDGTDSAAWKIEGLVRMEASHATAVLVGSATTVLSNVPNWNATVSADTTNGILKFEATGAAATNVRFVATINTSEVIYA